MSTLAMQLGNIDTFYDESPVGIEADANPLDMGILSGNLSDDERQRYIDQHPWIVDESEADDDDDDRA